MGNVWADIIRPRATNSRPDERFEKIVFILLFQQIKEIIMTDIINLRFFKIFSKILHHRNSFTSEPFTGIFCNTVKPRSGIFVNSLL